jgi:acetyl-CoA carboxylase carboxyltransferase component
MGVAGEAVVAPLTGTVVSVVVADGATVRAGDELVLIEAMKMHHGVTAPVDGVLRSGPAGVGDVINEGDLLCWVEPAEVDAEHPAPVITAEDLDAIRPDLATVLDRHTRGLDAARPDAVAKRRARGQRTARENVDAVCDPGTFVEYGPLTIAAQRSRRSLDDLIERTPADGLVAGLATVNADRFGTERTGCVVLAYDYTVLAGTQGHLNHRKTDRMLDIAERNQLGVVFFVEGGGGRPGDTDSTSISGLTTPTFHTIARLSGQVPLVGVVSGRCFAGNAALLGCCDVIISTENAAIGMGGPAMISGGGLGEYEPDEIGPAAVQYANGVVDLLVPDEVAAAAVARHYLSYFQGDAPQWTCADQRVLRTLVPADRKRAYDIRAVVTAVADTDSVLELRGGFGAGMVTCLARIEGRPLGLLANNPAHLGGAIDAEGAQKAAHFLRLCDAHGLPVVSLTDTPGFMVGPDAERTATVRHFGRLFVTGANLGVPNVTVVLRKAYGLGAQAMATGTFTAPRATVAWPTGEIGAMGLEGAVKLGFRRELAAAEDPAATLDFLIARAYEHAGALNVASVFEIDDVIDPADTRRWILAALRTNHPTPASPRRRYVDPW